MKQIKRNKKKPLRKRQTFPAIPKQYVEKLDDFLTNIEKIETGERIAVFNLNNTLLVNDITEASIAYLLENEIEIGLKWQEYQKLIAEGNENDAYIKASQAFTGMESGCVKRFADVVLDMKDEFITFFENDFVFKVPVPRINPHFKRTINLLKKNKFKIYILSASNQYLTETAAKRLLIPAKNCFGIKHSFTKYDDIQVLDSKIIEPVPIGKGKKEVYQKQISKNAPLFTAVNKFADLPLLKLTSENGFIIWTGKNKLDNRTISKFKTKRFYHYTI